MSLAPVISPYQPINGLTGLGLNNGFLYIGVDGQDPEANPQACFWDSAGAIPATQPVDILGGYPMRLGTPTRLYTASTYSIRVRDRSGVQVFYEAHAVPGASTAGGIFATIADAIAASIPASAHLTGVQTLGYYAALDGGGGYYRYSAVMPAHPGRFQSADGAWWELTPDIIGVNLRAHGAKGDGVTDDTAALQNATLQARVMACLAVHAPAGNYVVKLSQDFTYATAGRHGLSLIGDGAWKTIFTCSVFTEAYPAFDFTGNGEGVARGFTVVATGNACQATTLFLGAKNTINFSGNGLVLTDVRFLLPTSGYHANNYAGAVLASVDRSELTNCYAAGPRGWHLSGYRPVAVTSKFQAHSAQVDWTQCALINVVGNGSLDAALVTSGNLKFAGANYFAVTPSGAATSPCIVRVSTGGINDGAGGECDGFFRTENQAGTVGVIALLFEEARRGWNISAELETDAGGAAIGCISRGSLGSSRLKIDSDAALGNAALLSMCDIVTGSISSLGTLAAGCFGLRFTGGGITAAALLAAGVKHFDVMRNDNTWTRSGDLIMDAPLGTANMTGTAFLNRFTGGAAYVAPAEQLIETFTIPRGLVGNVGTVGGAGAAGFKAIMDCTKTGAAAVNGRMRVQLAQGANTCDIYDTGAALTAGQSRMTVNMRVFSLSGVLGIRAKVDGLIGASVLAPNFVNVQGFGIDANSDITCNIYWTNTVDASFQIDQIEAAWG